MVIYSSKLKISNIKKMFTLDEWTVQWTIKKVWIVYTFFIRHFETGYKIYKSHVYTHIIITSSHLFDKFQQSITLYIFSMHNIIYSFKFIILCKWNLHSFDFIKRK